MSSRYFSMVYICFREHIFFKICTLFAYQMVSFSLCFIFIFFSVYVSIDEEPYGRALKFKQNSKDGFYVVLFISHSQVVIRTSLVKYPGRNTRYKLTLPVDPTPCLQWGLKHNYSLSSMCFSRLSDSATTSYFL